ncbi:MAG: hypothetical protein JNM88_00065 [Chitinophagaceae bacterium]|nr:hypothetical protein [Chitinophagaceae bacterium]
MRKLFIPILLACIIISCSKDEAPAVQPGNNFANEKDKINAWLEKQKKTANAKGLARITALQQNLEFASIVKPSLSGDEYLYIIPIKEGFGSKNNAERKPLSNLVLFINKNKDTIRKGNIVQYISPEPVTREKLQQLLYNYYEISEKTFTGSLAYLTVADEMDYEIGYKGGDYSYYKSIKKRPSTGRNATCYEIGWYYFWADGSVTWEAIGEYCDGCEPAKTILTKTYRIGCGGGGTGQGGVDDSPTRLKTWEVYSENMYAGPIKIFAQIQLWGKKDSDYPQGGYFYKSVDQGSYTENFSTYNISLMSTYTQSWHGTAHGYQTFQGTIVYNSPGAPDKYVANSKTFQFAEVFP